MGRDLTAMTTKGRVLGSLHTGFGPPHPLSEFVLVATNPPCKGHGGPPRDDCDCMMDTYIIDRAGVLAALPKAEALWRERYRSDERDDRVGEFAQAILAALDGGESVLLRDSW